MSPATPGWRINAQEAHARFHLRSVTNFRMQTIKVFARFDSLRMDVADKTATRRCCWCSATGCFLKHPLLWRKFSYISPFGVILSCPPITSSESLNGRYGVRIPLSVAKNTKPLFQSLARSYKWDEIVPSKTGRHQQMTSWRTHPPSIFKCLPASAYYSYGRFSLDFLRCQYYPEISIRRYEFVPIIQMIE